MSTRAEAAQLAEILAALPTDAPQRPQLQERLHHETNALLGDEHPDLTEQDRRERERVARAREERDRWYVESEKRRGRQLLRARRWRSRSVAVLATLSVLGPVLVLLPFLAPAVAALLAPGAVITLAAISLWIYRDLSVGH